MPKAIFYHAGCPVCVSAEQQIVNLVDRSKYDLEVIHFADKPDTLSKAESIGVKSVPALVIDDTHVLHLNFGASLEDVKKLLATSAGV